MKHSRPLACITLGGFLCVGCQGGGGAATTQPTTLQAGPMQMSITAQAVSTADPRDPRPQLNAAVHLDIYLLDMPAGSVSQNREFWSRVDELAIGIDASDRLKRNGIRSGVAPRSEGLFFSQFFDKQPHHARRTTIDGVHADTMELELEKKYDHQDLFFFDASDDLEGKSYDHATDKLVLTFGPTPRDLNSVRLTLCPRVTSDKTEMHFTALNQENETTQKSVDRLYDVSLTADVPVDSFMIIAPSGDATRLTSIGNRFLVKEEKSERLEQVIVIVPSFLRFDGKPTIVHEGFLK